MKSFRTPRYLERYEDVVFDLENRLEINPNNTQHQNRYGLKIVADNSGETTPFDWYNARLSVNFKVNKLADGAAITVIDTKGTVNGSHSLIKKIQVRAEGREVYDCHYANHCVNIKNLLEYNPSCAKSVGTNEYYFPDTTRHANTTKYNTRTVADTGGTNRNLAESDNANYNKGFAARKLLLGASAKVNCEISLNRYSLFQELQDKLLPNVKIELQIEMENDKNLIWRGDGQADAAGTTYRLIVTRLQLFVPRLIFNSEGQKLYLENYLITETTYNQDMRTQRTGNFRLTNGILKPRHVFIFFIKNTSLDNQLENPFLYDTFTITTDPTNPALTKNLTQCHLEVGNGNEYPHLNYEPQQDPSRVFRDVMKYVNANNDLQGGTLLNISNFKNLYPFIYFDLTKQRTDLRDGNTKLSFHYTLSGTIATDYTIYGIVLSEKEAEISKESGKLLLRG